MTTCLILVVLVLNGPRIQTMTSLEPESSYGTCMERVYAIRHDHPSTWRTDRVLLADCVPFGEGLPLTRCGEEKE